jgi:hypothetical protein
MGSSSQSLQRMPGAIFMPISDAICIYANESVERTRAVETVVGRMWSCLAPPAGSLLP